MSLREKLRNFIQEQSATTAKRKETELQKNALLVRVRSEKEKELNDLVSVASHNLLPLLELVNEEKFNNQGQIKISKKGPFLRMSTSLEDSSREVEEYHESYVEAALEKTIEQHTDIGYERSASGFRLRLRINIFGEVKVLGAKDNVLLEADLNEEEASEKLERAIYSAVTNGDCGWSVSGRLDLSR